MFLISILIFSAVVLALFFLLKTKTEKINNDGKSLSIFWIVCIMAICLFMNSYFKTLAARYIDSAILYPLSTGVNLILSLIMSQMFFKEKINLKCIIGMILAFVALLIMNL